MMTSNTQTSHDRIDSRSWISEYKDEISEGELIVSRRVFSDTVARIFGALNNEDDTEKQIPSIDEFLSRLPSSRSSSGTFTLKDAERRRLLSGGSTGGDSELLRELLSSASAPSAASPTLPPPLPLNQSREASWDAARERVLSLGSLSFLDSFFPSPRATSISTRSSESDVFMTEMQTKATEGEGEPTLTLEDKTEDQSEPSLTEPTVPQEPPAKKRDTRITSRTPSTTIASRGYVEVQTWDFLSERGGRGNNHIGNKRVHKLLSQLKETYREIETKRGKTQFVHAIVAYVKSYGGRFLKKDTKTGRYNEMTPDEARRKASQCIRENKPLKWTAVDIEDEDDAFLEFYVMYIG